MTLAEKKIEKWIPVKGFEGHYVISKSGLVKRLRFDRKTNNGFQPVPEKTLKPYQSKNGYLVVDLRVGNKRKMSYIHRLLATHFIPNPSNYPVVNHKDGIKTNNSLLNLEWCSYSVNNQHAIDTGLNKGYSVLTENEVREIKKLLEINESPTKLAKKYNVSRGAIIGIKSGKNWKRLLL